MPGSVRISLHAIINATVERQSLQAECRSIDVHVLRQTVKVRVQQALVALRTVPAVVKACLFGHLQLYLEHVTSTLPYNLAAHRTDHLVILQSAVFV